jgi:hypothetical protein
VELNLRLRRNFTPGDLKQGGFKIAEVDPSRWCREARGTRSRSPKGRHSGIKRVKKAKKLPKSQGAEGDMSCSL